MRIPFENLLCLRDAHKFQHAQRFGLRLGPAQALMQHDRFRHLHSHGEHGVEGGHGLLKDHGNFAAPDSAHGRFIRLCEIKDFSAATPEGNFASGNGAATILDQTHDRQGCHRFPGA